MGINKIANLTQPEPELYHYGILGQKWGIRRYQNKDGTLTERGKIHYAKLEKQLSDLNPSFEKKSSPDTTGRMKKKVKDMSDEEIVARTNRLKLEKAFADAQYERSVSVARLTPQKEPKTKQGNDRIKKLGQNIWKDVGAPVAKDAASKLVKNILKEKFGVDDTPTKSPHDVAKENSEYWTYMNNARKQRDEYTTWANDQRRN